MGSVTGSLDTSLRLWRATDGGLVAELKGHKDKVLRVAVNPIDGSIASGSFDGEIRLWDGHTGQYLRTLTDQRGLIAALTFSHDGTRLLSTCGSLGCKIIQYVWEVPSGKQLVAYAKHDNIVAAAAISPDGKLAARGGGANGDVQIWNLQTGATQRVLRGDGASNWAVAFSRDSQRIAWGAAELTSLGRERILPLRRLAIVLDLGGT